MSWSASSKSSVCSARGWETGTDGLNECTFATSFFSINTKILYNRGVFLMILSPSDNKFSLLISIHQAFLAQTHLFFFILNPLSLYVEKEFYLLQAADLTMEKTPNKIPLHCPHQISLYLQSKFYIVCVHFPFPPLSCPC